MLFRSPLAGPILANTTSNTTAVLDIRRNTEFTSLYFKGYPSGVNAATITFTFKPSLDGITLVDQPKFTWAITFAASTNFCQFATNFSTQAYGYLKLDTIALSNNTDSFTMQDFQYGIKNVARTGTIAMPRQGTSGED